MEPSKGWDGTFASAFLSGAQALYDQKSSDNKDKYTDGLRARSGSSVNVPLLEVDSNRHPSTPPKDLGWIPRSIRSPCRRWLAISSPRQQAFLAAVALVLLCGGLYCFTAGRGPRPFPRDNPNAIFSPGPGSHFGHLWVHMDCPALQEPNSWRSYLNLPSSQTILPRTLFPSSAALPHGQTSAAPAISKAELSGTPPEKEPPLMLLVGVLSACKEGKRRQAVRDTWMRLQVRPGFTWRAVFLLSKTTRCMEQLREEQEEYGDLVFLDAPETYYAITRKVILFLEYAKQTGAQYTLKTDDDTFVFVDRILEELHRMPDQCVYWGNGAHLPKMEGYNASGLDVPLNKWYIDPENYKTLADVRYMAGGGYIMSHDVIKKAVETSKTIEVPDWLPEDATVGHLIGDDMYSRCACADTRHLAHVAQFQHIKLFHPAVLPCERADVMQRVLTMHGVKNLTHLEWIMDYATEEQELECDIENRVYSGDLRKRLWGRKFHGSAHHVNPIGATSILYKRLHQKMDDPWDKRHNFTSYEAVFPNITDDLETVLDDTESNESEEEPRPLKYPARELVPLVSVLDIGFVDNNGSSTKTTDVPAKRLPWCLQAKWALQLLRMLEDMITHQQLLCDLDTSHFFVHKPTMDLLLDKGQLPKNYGETWRFMEGPCFADEQCHACFLKASETWLPNARCNNDTAQCPGFDGIAQAKVAFREVLPHILQPEWGEAVWEGTTCRCIAREQGLKHAIDAFMSGEPGEDVDAEAKQLSIITSILKEIVDRPWTDRCFSMLPFWAEVKPTDVKKTRFWWFARRAVTKS